MHANVVDTLRELVAIPSVNPMGGPADGEIYFEERVTDYLEARLRALGVPHARQTIEPRRDNLAARLDGRRDRLLLWEAHQDTVPVDGMTIDPWDPIVEGGRVYGRGACDIKGGLAAMLTAFARLAEDRSSRLPTLVLAFSVNEECGFSGASGLARWWREPDSVISRAPDAVVVAEPTELDVVVAHKGVVRWTCRTTGRAAHSSDPGQGESAIYRMARVVAALEQYAGDVVPGMAAHELVGNATLSVGTIHGGVSVNTIPDHCEIEIDRRLVPGEDPDEAMRHAADYLTAAIGEEGWAFDEPFLVSTGLLPASDGSLASRLASASRRHGGRGRQVGVPFGTDAPALAADGAATVVFGPGSIAQAHTRDEWIAIDQLEAAVDILVDFARSEA